MIAEMSDELVADVIPQRKKNVEPSLVKRTQALIGTLNNDQLNKVFTFTTSLIKDDNNPFGPVTKEQVLRDLDASDEDIREGRVKDAHQAMKDIKDRLGMRV